ncbi:hypothetical protein [Brachybacterium hainanense]|uniref:Uncharacterized protein n=1 Tax=Brachybacterium hainanense TaxID=1541174 RepID=A0ABV6RGG2_9MICO
MVLKVLALTLIVLLLALRLLRGRFGSALLGVSETVLDLTYVGLLAITLGVSIWAEQWLLVVVCGVLLVLRGIEELRRRGRERRA